MTQFTTTLGRSRGNEIGLVIGPQGEDPMTIEFARLLAAEIGPLPGWKTQPWLCVIWIR